RAVPASPWCCCAKTARRNRGTGSSFTNAAAFSDNARASRYGPGSTLDTVEAVDRRHPIRLRHGRIVERGIDEIADRVVGRRLAHHRLADVDDLHGLITEAVDAEHFQA